MYSKKEKAYPREVEIPVDFKTKDDYLRSLTLSVQMDNRCKTDDFEEVRKAILKACDALVACYAE